MLIPWSAILPVGELGWRNGHGATCATPWPGCVDPQPLFFSSPQAGHVPANDDSPAITEPGRFAKDVTAIASASGDLKPVHFQYGKVGGRCAR